MRDLTSAELEVINNSTRVLDKNVLLGDYLQAAVDEVNEKIPKALGLEGTPVNAASAEATLTFTGIVLDGEFITIGYDVYEFAADEAQSVVQGRIPVDITSYTVKATGNLTMPVQPTSGDKVTLGTKVYTFVPVGTDTADGEVSVGGNLAGAQANFVAAVNGTDGISEAHPLVKAGNFVANVCAITALVGSTAGNLIATTETFTAGTNVFSSGFLLTGADCTAVNAATALVAAITAGDTQGVTAVDGEGNAVVITAEAGAEGNYIGVISNVANASFGAEVEALTGGADQTNPHGARFMIDEDAMYVYVAGTWLKLVLGTL